MKKFGLRLAYLLTAGLLTSCSSVAPPPAQPTTNIPVQKREASVSKIHSWLLNGKIAVQAPKDSGSATVSWFQTPGRYSISMTGPLGSNSIKIDGQPGHVTLKTADGKQFSANSAEQLLAQQWGWRLPVSNLNYWIRALPVPKAPYDRKVDNYGRVSQLRQQGWNMDYLSYTTTAGVDLPSKINFTSPDLKVKIIVYEWKVS